MFTLIPYTIIPINILEKKCGFGKKKSYKINKYFV